MYGHCRGFCLSCLALCYYVIIMYSSLTTVLALLRSESGPVKLWAIVNARATPHAVGRRVNTLLFT